MEEAKAVKGKYAESLKASEKDKDLAKVGFKVEKSHLGLQSAVLQTKEELSGANLHLAELKGTYPLDFQAILGAQADVEELTAALGALGALEQELFS